MRLLDLIAQGHCDRVYSEDGRELENARQFSDVIKSCPLRYVLSNELVRCATQLAYAEGDRLSHCLDLVHIPARSLWVEWEDAPRRDALSCITSLGLGAGNPPRHAGAWISAAQDCRSAHMRTFWSFSDDRACLSPVVTRLDFDRTPETTSPHRKPDWRGDATLRFDGEPALEELLTHLRYHFDDQWGAYYQARCGTAELRTQVLRANLNGCAFDAPMLMAFFLLLGARDVLPCQEVRLDRLNRIRKKSGKQPLLEHIEVAAPLYQALRPMQPTASFHRPRRRHHVRGHIVRRGSSVFWRSPHLRGSPQQGHIGSRTVVLRFGAAPA